MDFEDLLSFDDAPLWLHTGRTATYKTNLMCHIIRKYHEKGRDVNVWSHTPTNIERRLMKLEPQWDWPNLQIGQMDKEQTVTRSLLCFDDVMKVEQLKRAHSIQALPRINSRRNVGNSPT